MSKTEQVPIQFDASELETLHEEAEKKGVTVAALLRGKLDMFDEDVEEVEGKKGYLFKMSTEEKKKYQKLADKHTKGKLATLIKKVVREGL